MNYTPRRCTRAHRERGSVTAFVVVLAATFIILGGLIYDAGLAMAAKTSAIDEAQQAARAAAQALNPAALRNHTLVTTPGRAESDAKAYIAAAGDTGTVAIDGDQITVHITHHQPTSILGLIGVGQISVTGDATAQIEQGVTNSGQGG